MVSLITALTRFSLQKRLLDTGREKPDGELEKYQDFSEYVFTTINIGYYSLSLPCLLSPVA